jgi:murein L,D-transpeptidase YcbB/YkuD
MGARGLVARLDATARGFLIAFLVAGFAFVVRAETQPAEVAAASPSGVDQATPAEAAPDSSAATPPGDDNGSPSADPASAGQEPFAAPATPAGDNAGAPADTVEGAAPVPADDASASQDSSQDSSQDTVSVPPSETEAPAADSAALAPDAATQKPADAAPAVPAESPQQIPEDAGAGPAAPAAPADVGQTQPSDPVMLAIKEKLKDPALRKEAASDDLAALQAFYGGQGGRLLWITPMGFTAKAQGLITEIQKAGDWGLSVDAFDLPPASDLPADVQAQATDETKLSLAVLKYARFARGGRLSPSRISVLFDQKPNVKDPKTVLSEIAGASSPGDYLVALHPKQPQFEILRKALIKAVASAKGRGRKPASDPAVQQIIVNMERWRWMPPELGAYYVWNNIPAFTARVMKDGKSIYVEKVIVGQVKYATPIFSAAMRSIVFNPEWTVPDTIKFEDLQPRLRQSGPSGTPDVSILRENKLAVSFKGRQLDPETVDWGRANIRQYTFTQPPGPDNVLGVLKFNFPNRHAIYMHDTVQPELFKESVRTLSHGCIRVHEPDRLAALLLAEDKGWSPGQVKSLLAKGNNSGVVLKRPVPVHLTYFTLATDGVGKLQTYDDVYGIDAKMAAALFGKAEQASAASVPGAQQKKRSASNGTGILPGLFGN